MSALVAPDERRRVVRSEPGAMGLNKYSITVPLKLKKN
jgi:hypothetical protein